jgi:hypothetical protein
MKKFYVKDCPEDKSLFDWMNQNLDFETAKKDVKNSYRPTEVIDLPHRYDVSEIKKITLDCLDTHGFKGWQTTKGSTKAYGGLSMVYNPDIKETVDPNQSTLGTAINRPDEFFYGKMEKFNSPRNTYFDSYGFRKLSPAIENSGLKNFISDFTLSPTRSRIALLDGSFHDRVGEEFLWHRDEEIFENLRINIPLTTDHSFLFQLENQDPFHLEIGKFYTWDTNLAHRVYMNTATEIQRVHLVLGFMPWINYLPDEDAFEANEFFGNVHPFDILVQGYANNKIGHVDAI